MLAERSHTMGSRTILLALLLVASSASASGCGAVATSPAWVGGGLAETGPLKAAQRDAAEYRDRLQRASQPKEIGARHILVMHAASRAKPEGITRSRAEARERAEQCLHELRAGAHFADMVRQYSDEPGAAERGGDLGVFGREAMVSSFADAAFALEVGEVSEVVETPYGFHIINRTE